MKKAVLFQQEAFEAYIECAVRDKQLFGKINKLIKDIEREPFSGLGMPEPLKYERSGFWSRRINHEDRLVYQITDETIIIYSCKGHYI